MRTVITFGTFDVLHIGHINILQRAKAYGDRLVVGVSSDALNFSKKQRNPVYPEFERTSIIAALNCVDEVFIEESLELKAEYIKKYKADILIMGNDWEGKFDIYKDICEVHYLPRTEGISTSELIAMIKKYN
ncbi:MULTISPECIES: adenylyltransferase/cytidyltransferase family protein [unclassified Atlantibacter]|uniref:adenylyltransferase/cytidyltransferase family protein n=1 Tax=unclassified Atlantibacter TaxID=2649394 RepID=UPI00160619FC|nr:MULTISPECIES: adenylyltransferase/cytidyltransferase family protein [unclassified Atlantibacter]MBB3322576.1 glycerol-3-phosphate cytidylyltransferase [Atlantibacter sp. RC6]